MAHKFLQGDIVQGNHPPLISKEIFLKVNGELSKNHSGYEQKIDKEYAPLLGSIKCPCCGKNLSASISTKMRKKFGRTDIGYYVCCRKGCKYNSSTKKVHEAFEEEVNKYALSDKVSELLKMQLTITFEYMNQENRERAKSIKANIKAKEKEGQRKILRGISDKILSLCETNESSAIMETNGYRLLLPEGTLDYFNISDVKESSSEIVIYLEEKNELPGEYSTVKVESKGFYDPVVVRDFPIRGKNLFLNIRRRRWILKDEGRYVSRNWKLVAEGSRMTHEFASFLKELY